MTWFYELPPNQRSLISIEPDRISNEKLDTIKQCTVKDDEPELVTKKLTIDDEISSEFKEQESGELFHALIWRNL